MYSHYEQLFKADVNGILALPLQSILIFTSLCRGRRLRRTLSAIAVHSHCEQLVKEEIRGIIALSVQ